MEFTANAIQKHMDGRFKAFVPSAKFPVEKRLYKDSLKETIQKAIGTYPAINDWHDVQAFPMDVQQDLWLLRDWLNENIFAHVVRTIQEAKAKNLDQVEQGGYARQFPSGFNIGDYVFFSFGSSKVTSDIDVTIEGPHASFLIACLEDAWLVLTGKGSRVWDVEYYGDFLMFHDVKTASDIFLNSRRFEPYKERIMPYVGVSILRNGVDLNSPEIDAFIAAHPTLASPGWKEKAKQLYESVKNLDYQSMRGQYYKALQRAESYRDSKMETENQRHFETFLALAHANMFRSENYILPSTVIHVVRDIQAKSPKPDTKSCEIYQVKLASCALGKFTYLASALEQLGYRLRFKGEPAKEQKYQERLDNALEKSGEQTGGRRKCLGKRRGRTVKSRRAAKRRSRKIRRSKRRV